MKIFIQPSNLVITLQQRDCFVISLGSKLVSNVRMQYSYYVHETQAADTCFYTTMLGGQETLNTIVIRG